MLHDRELREPLFEFLEDKYGKVRIFEEKVMGSSRADVMMVGERDIYGIEIKSDADSYARLERQVHDYNLTFDYNIVAVGTKHAAHIEEHVPDWWGIITMEEAEGKVDILMLREPRLNPRDHYIYVIKRQIQFLWRPELAGLMEKNGFPRYPGKSKKYVQDYLIEHVDHNELREQICFELLERDYDELLKRISEYKAKKEKSTGKTKKRGKKRRHKKSD